MKAQYKASIFLILTTLFWAGNFVFGKFVAAELTPLQLTFLRWLLAVLLLFPIAHWYERPSWPQVWREWKKLLALALLGMIGYNLILYQALHFTSSLNAALINSINPALIFLTSAWLLKERLSLTNSMGILVSLLGVLLVLTDGRLQHILSIEFNPGDLLMLAAILTWNLYTLMGRRMQSVPPIAATAVSALLSVLVLLPFVWMTGLPAALSREAMIGVVYVAVFASVAAFLLWNSAILLLKAGQAGVYLNLITVFTAILSVLLGNTVTAVQIIGGLVVFTGVYLTTQKKKNSGTEKSSSQK